MRELWNYQNSIYLNGLNNSDQICFGFFQESITKFIQKRNLSKSGISSIREFFKHGAPLLSDFLLSMQTYLLEILNQRQSSDHSIVREGCRILNVCFIYQ